MARDMNRAILCDKVAVITGGARGIGKAIAAEFLQSGAKVVIVSRTPQQLDQTATEFQDLSSNVISVIADVSNFNDIKKFVERTLSVFGTIDILVNCAAIQEPIGPFIEVNIEQWQANIRTNLFGTVMSCKAVLPMMVKNGWGKIINFSGGGATSPRPNFSAYATAKTAVVRFTETLALEVKPYCIDVNAIAPGAVNTRMTQEIVAAKNRAGKVEFSHAMRVSRNSGVSAKRAAELAVFLASDQSNGITGRLLSAVWDDWQSLGENTNLMADSGLFTLRRIDGKNFVQNVL
jgi:NAD(P)-dependent dehydrogenase (short-subunit alcohol dehydrogenase family)